MRGVAIGGFMASGKTTVGRLVAAGLGLPFVDLDALVEETAGQSVPQLFAGEGEQAFRRREAAAVDQVLSGPEVVVALGGGTLHHGDNLQRLRGRFRIVVLDLPWDELAPRLSDPRGRPLAAQAQPLWQARRPGYLGAGVVVDVSGLGPQAAADAVLEHL